MRDRALGSTIRMQFNSTNPDGGGAPVAPSSAFVVADIRIYKDGSATEKTTTNGLTVTSPFDSITGLHLVEIDTSNSTGDVGFWASGSVYHVRLVTAKTVATYSVSGLLIGEFSIELQTADVRKFGGTAGTFASGIPAANATQFAGQTITAAAGVTIPASIASPTNITAGTITTVTTLTGHTPQTGDSFARIGALGAGLTSLSTQISVDALGGSSAVTVERSISDTKSITFAWPVSGATITGTQSIDNGTYGAVTGAIAFLRTESSKHYYTLAYDAADRPTAEGQVRYKFEDGTYTRYVVLRTVTTVLDSTDKAALVDLIWDEPLTGATHNVATSSGKRLRQTTAFQQIDSTVIDASATTTMFVTGLASSVDHFHNDSMLVFTDGALAGQVRAIYDYVGETKTIILQEALTSAPANGVAFAIVSLHVHPVSQIQNGLATSAELVTLRGADNDTLKTLSDQIDTVSADVSGLNDLSAAEVNAEVVDVLSVDTFAELTAPPAATSSLKDKITWLFMYARNKVTQTSSQRKLYLEDTTTVAGTSGTSDNGTTFTKGEDS